MYKVYKKIISSTLMLAMLLSFPVSVWAGKGSMENFESDISYTSGQFSDVNEACWYGADCQQSVKKACELGLMKGEGSTFNPDGNVTLAQAITMAARLFATYSGDSITFVQGNPWYKVYVDYCIEKEIVQFCDFLDYNKPATRAQVAYIFANALPEFEFPKINRVEYLPDVTEVTTFGKEIFLLYNAGVLSGSDSIGTFEPNATINRAAIAAIVSREALVTERVSGLQFLSATGDITLFEEASEIRVDEFWNQNYTSGMKVDTVDQLQWILCAAAANMIPNFRLKIASAIFNNVRDYLPNGIDTLKWSYSSGSYYDTKFYPNYNTYGEVKALLQSDMAWGYATNSAKTMYTHLYGLLDQMHTAGKSDEDKVTLIHDYIVRNYEYDTTFTKFSFTDFLDTGSGVCQAYAQMFDLLSTMAGVETQYLEGTAVNSSGDRECHAWNRVFIDDVWYYVDVTWDDPIPDKGFSSTVSTKYLLIDEGQMDKDHTLDKIDGKAVE